MERQNPKPGEIYKHFKNKLYQIITVATHSETGERMVVYQALYGSYKTYVRPLDMFLSRVDKEKYKDVESEYRFELIELTDEGHPEESLLDTSRNIYHEEITQIKDIYLDKQDKANIKAEEGKINSILLEFLDADTYAEKLSLLNKNRKQLTEQLLNDMAVSLDVTVEDGDLDTRIDGLIFCLQTFIRFEDRRLR